MVARAFNAQIPVDGRCAAGKIRGEASGVPGEAA
jgi:hypothetical protein